MILYTLYILVKLGLGYRAGYVLPGFFLALLALFVIVGVAVSLVSEKEKN
jgi:hypothetical protein